MAVKTAPPESTVIDQVLTEKYALYNGDSIKVMQGLPANSIDLTIYSPPFSGDGRQGALYHYSSSPHDLSNATSYEQFLAHYDFIVKETFRLTKPGRMVAVHCMDVPLDGANAGAGLADFPGDIIRLHRANGFQYACRYHIWKEPLAVRNRTMSKGLAHRQVVEDSSLCDVASADYLLLFRKRGENKVPIAHPVGLTSYAGERQIPAELHKYRGWTGKQTENRFSHWIWRQYASAFWDDVRVERVLPYKESREPDDERHCHPLQTDVIERGVVLWSNPGEVVASWFAGVGSELFGAVINGRRAIGCELKAAYYKQAVKNLKLAETYKHSDDMLLSFMHEQKPEDWPNFDQE